eukprot:scaffold214595_cov44-Prasinocladus_malaysianus.AAC.1
MVADVLENGASLILQLLVGEQMHGSKTASARQQVTDDWVQRQGQNLLWRGHLMDRFPKDLTNLPKAQTLKYVSTMLRQARADINEGLRDEDLRNQLVDAAGSWEVERVLACETPSQTGAVRLPYTVVQTKVISSAKQAIAGPAVHGWHDVMMASWPRAPVVTVYLQPAILTLLALVYT